MSDGPLYQLVQVAGTGAVAVVVVARQIGQDGPPVALKVLRPAYVHDAAVVRRFRDEARILGCIEHPNVVQVHRLLDYDGRLVLQMEWVDGGTVESVLADGPVELGPALWVIRGAAEALQAAWSARDEAGRKMRIVHRDIKPANMGLTHDGHVKLLDFGYAKGEFVGRAAQSLHDVWGTLGYEAPDRLHGGVDPLADVYALGVTLFVLLTQRPLLLSMKPGTHGPDLDKALGRLPQGADQATDLIRRMVCHDRQGRPALQDVVARVDELLQGLSGPAESARSQLAQRVQAHREGRFQIGLTLDAAFAEVRFVEDVPPSPPARQLPVQEARRRVRHLLSLADWHDRVPELEALLEAQQPVQLDGLYSVIARALAPSWKLWTARPQGLQVESALLLLRRFDEPRAREAARRLVSHPSEVVGRAAAFVLGN